MSQSREEQVGGRKGGERERDREKKGLTDKNRWMREREINSEWKEKGVENILRLKAEEKCQMAWLDKEAY